jgi:hemerythrin
VGELVALQWSSTLSLGVADLDAQHRELFERVDRLLDAMLRGDRSEAATLASFLREHVVLHFAAEERLMREHRYPDTAAHAAEHAAFAGSMLELDATMRQRGASAELVLRLEREVVAWIRDHVYVADVALGQFVTAARAAGASAARGTAAASASPTGAAPSPTGSAAAGASRSA